MKALLREVAHRPWPLPRGPWVMAQRWHELLFAHWPVAPEKLQALIPGTLTIDTFDRRAWVGIVPFRMSGVRLRGVPPLPGFSAFPELNVRTYVTADGKPGVWFFSLDATNAIAVAVARFWFHLPYFRAVMSCKRRNGEILYRSRRSHPGAPVGSFSATYRPAGTAAPPRPGTLEHFLTERYCLYSQGSKGRIYRGEIHHPAWRLQNAEAAFSENTIAEAGGVILPRTAPLLHFSKFQEMVAWPPELTP
jgi:uncharacterized protein